MCKKLWQTLCSVTVAIAIIVTSFLCVKADQAADVASILSKVNSIYSRLGTMNTKMSYGGQDFTWFLNEIWGDTLDISTSITQFEADIAVIQGNTQQYIDGDPTDSDTLLLATSYWEQIVQLLAESYNKMNVMAGSTAEEVQQLTQINNKLVSLQQTAISIQGTLNSMASDISTIRMLADYDFIDQESLTAYHIFQNHGWDGTFNYSQFKYPSLDIPGISNVNYSGSFNQEKRISVLPHDTSVIAFYCDLYLLQGPVNSGNNRSIYYYVMNDASGVTVELTSEQSERVTYHGYLLKIFIHNDSDALRFVSFDILYNQGNMYIVPLYAGSTRFISNRMKSIIQYDNDILLKDLQQTNETWFDKIYRVIVGDPDSTNKTQQDIDSMNQKVDQLQTSLDGYNDQFEAVQDDVDPSGLLTNIQGYSNQIGRGKNLMQDIYNSFGDIKWLFLLPLMIGLILLFVG